MATLQLPGLAGFNLDAYCARLGYAGGREPTLATLREIQWRHVSAIPFENLASLAGDPVPLDLPALQAKMVDSRRGGYCFEHNILYAAALQRLGFAVTGLAARVMWKAPAGRIGPRTHMLLKIDLPGGTCIADTGFGGASLPAPLEFATGRVQATRMESFRLMAHPDGYQLEVQLQDEWRPMYSFDLQPQEFVDYQVANWFVSTHPASRFVQALLVARPDGNRRQTLLNNDLRLHEPGAEGERRQLRSVGELRLVLDRSFGIEAPRTARMDAALERILVAEN